MSVQEEFKILTPREHVRLRMGMYVGSPSVEQVDRFILGKWTSVKYIPAIMKMVDEILDNSIDEAIRTQFKFANKIDVSIDNDTITITDNGRGIPHDNVKDEITEQYILRPVAAWTRVNAGTSFNQDRVTIGTNGVGSSATNFLSSSFIGKTWREGKEVQVNCTDGALNVDVTTKRRTQSGTSVQFTPDFSLFECSHLQEFDTISIIEDRLINLQLAFPEIAFSFNQEKISVTDIKKYVSMFVGEASSIIEKTDDLSFFFSSSVDGFRSNSYINGVNTRQGGSYVDFIVNGVVDELLPMIKRKYKIDASKSVVKNGLTFVMFARNFVDPKFDSQTKERLTSTTGSVKKHYESCGVHDFKFIAKKLLSAEDIISPIIASYIAKQSADEARDASLAQKKLKKVKVPKHISANKPDATLYLVEGDSALGFGLRVRDPDKVGLFPLRGVVMNTWDIKPADALKNKELSELIAILGLDITDSNSYKNMTYRNVATLTDSDHDGSGHISPLLVAFFYKFWPGLFNEGRIKITRSPIMISSKGKDTKWFYTYKEANDFKVNNVGYNHRYIKGLGSLTEVEYSSIINTPVFDTVTVDDNSYFDLMFGVDSNVRKEFMTK